VPSLNFRHFVVSEQFREENVFITQPHTHPANHPTRWFSCKWTSAPLRNDNDICRANGWVRLSEIFARDLAIFVNNIVVPSQKW